MRKKALSLLFYASLVTAMLISAWQIEPTFAQEEAPPTCCLTGQACQSGQVCCKIGQACSPDLSPYCRSDCPGMMD